MNLKVSVTSVDAFDIGCVKEKLNGPTGVKTFIPIPVIGTLLGETIGVWFGDMLYTLMFGGGLSAVGEKLKKQLLGIFNAGGRSTYANVKIPPDQTKIPSRTKVDRIASCSSLSSACSLILPRRPFFLGSSFLTCSAIYLM